MTVEPFLQDVGRLCFQPLFNQRERLFGEPHFHQTFNRNKGFVIVCGIQKNGNLIKLVLQRHLKKCDRTVADQKTTSPS